MIWIITPCRLIAVWMLCMAFGVTDGSAQSLTSSGSTTVQVEEIAPPSPNDVKELIRLLEDDRIRNWLRKGAADSADGEVSQPLSGQGLRAQLTALISRTRERVQLLKGAWKNLSQAPALVVGEWQRNLTGDETVRSLSYVLIFLFIGGGIEWLYRQYTSRRLLNYQLAVPESLTDRLRTAALRALLIFGGLAVFSFGSIGGFLSFQWSPFVEALVLNLLILVIVLRAISTLSMFVLAPRVRELRLAPLSDSLAKRVHFILIVSFSVVAVSLVAADIFSRLTGASAKTVSLEAASFSVSILAGLACLVVALIATWRIARHAITLQGVTGEAVFDDRLQRAAFGWRTYLSIIAIASFGLWLFAATDLMWTLLVMGLLPAVLSMMRSWVNYFFDQSEIYLLGGGRHREPVADNLPLSEDLPADEVSEEHEDVQEPAADERGPYDVVRLITIRFLRFVLVIAGVLIVLSAWGTDIFSLAESPTLYGKVASVVIDLIVALMIADLIWAWARTSIDRRLADYKPPEGPQAPGPEARMATLLPLLRVILLVTLVVMVGLSVLSSIGINIAPLLAGAGVLGVAIGFGAQSLVKDIVSGIFFLIDDAFRVGEYIEIGNLRGVVESMSVRSLRVRHHRGAVHTIPFGELSSLTNYSRDWVIMKMEFRVPFETDIKLVKKIVKRIGAEMMEDPLYQEGFLEPLKSQGVRRMEEFNMVVGVKFMARPGDQWIIRRDAYQKIVDAFEANGIRLAERNVKVEVISDRPLTEGEKKAAIGAAQDSIEPPAAAQATAPDEP